MIFQELNGFIKRLHNLVWYIAELTPHFKIKLSVSLLPVLAFDFHAIHFAMVSDNSNVGISSSLMGH